MSQHIYRGFIAFFVEKGKDPADRQNHMVCPVLADDEHESVVSFLDAFKDERQLIGLQSLEELETLRRMILRLAEEKEVALQRVRP